MSFLDQEALEDMEVIPYLFQDDNNTGNPFLSALLQNDGEAIESVLAGLHVPSESEFERRLVRDTTGNHDSSESSASESSDSNSISTETEGRGHRGPRGPRRLRDPYAAVFWTKYINKANISSPDDPSSIWEETSYEGQQFRRRFTLSYVLFNDIYLDWQQNGEYRQETDRVGHP